MGVLSFLPLQLRSATPHLECSAGTQPFRYSVSIVNPDRSFSNQPEVQSVCRSPRQPLGDELCPSGHRLVTFMRNGGGGTRVLCEASSASSAVSTGSRPPLVPPPVLSYSPSQLAAARREREDRLADTALLGPHYETWRNGRNGAYQSLSLSLLRIRYFMEGRQTDTSSIRGPLLEWLRAARQGRDAVFSSALQNLLQALRNLREPYNQERAQTILRLVEETERSVPPAAPTPTATPPPETPQPQTVSPPEEPTALRWEDLPAGLDRHRPSSEAPLSPSPPPEMRTPEPVPVVPRAVEAPPPLARVSPVSFTAEDREVNSIDALIRDLRTRAIPASRRVTDRYTRRVGQGMEITVRVRIDYTTETGGRVRALSYPPGRESLVQEILRAVAANLPRFRGHAGESAEIPLLFRYD